MLDRLPLPELPALRGERVILREFRESDIDDRLRHPIDPSEEDGYGSAWRREWDGRRYHTREYLAAARRPPQPGAYAWAVEYNRHCIGSAGLRVDAGRRSPSACPTRSGSWRACSRHGPWGRAAADLRRLPPLQRAAIVDLANPALVVGVPESAPGELAAAGDDDAPDLAAP